MKKLAFAFNALTVVWKSVTETEWFIESLNYVELYRKSTGANTSGGSIKRN